MSDSNPTPRIRQPIVLLFIGMSLVLFALSLPLDVVRVSGEGKKQLANGFVYLALGWLGVLGGVVSWLANPLLLAALILMRSRKRRVASLVCAIAALVLALTFMLYSQMQLAQPDENVTVIGLGPGYWLWIASMAAAVVGCGWMVIRDRRPSPA